MTIVGVDCSLGVLAALLSIVKPVASRPGSGYRVDHSHVQDVLEVVAASGTALPHRTLSALQAASRNP